MKIEILIIEILKRNPKKHNLQIARKKFHALRKKNKFGYKKENKEKGEGGEMKGPDGLLQGIKALSLSTVSYHLTH